MYFSFSNGGYYLHGKLQNPVAMRLEVRGHLYKRYIVKPHPDEYITTPSGNETGGERSPLVKPHPVEYITTPSGNETGGEWSPL